MKLLFYNWKTFVFANKNCKLLYVNALYVSEEMRKRYIENQG